VGDGGTSQRTETFRAIIRADPWVYTMHASKQIEQFKQLLQSRIAETERTIVDAEHEMRAISARQADTADQAAAEYERQTLAHKAAVARQTLRNLTQALERIREGTFGECAQCGNDIESKRLEAIPWARYCLKCQELREHQ
jgi:RNA polymerase-binding transcription factor